LTTWPAPGGVRARMAHEKGFGVAGRSTEHDGGTPAG
jgi:hypothetical protein